MTQTRACPPLPTELRVEQPAPRLSDNQLKTLREFEAPQSVANVATGTYDRHRLSTMVLKFVKRGLLTRVGPGLYTLTDLGRDAITPGPRVTRVEMPGAPLPPALAHMVLTSAPTFMAAARDAGVTAERLAPRLGAADTFVSGDAASVALGMRRPGPLFNRARHSGVPIAQRHLPLPWLEREAQARQAPLLGEESVGILAREFGLSAQEGTRRARQAGLALFFRLNPSTGRSLHVDADGALTLRALLGSVTPARSTSSADIESHVRAAGPDGLIISQVLPLTDLARETVTVHLDRLVNHCRLQRFGYGAGIPSTYRHVDFSHLPDPVQRRHDGRAVVPRETVEAAVTAGGPLGVTINDLRDTLSLSDFGLYTHVRALVAEGRVQEFGGQGRTNTLVWRHVTFAEHPTDGLSRRPNAQQHKTQADKDWMLADLRRAGPEGLPFRGLIAACLHRATHLTQLIRELVAGGLVDYYPSTNSSLPARYRHAEFRAEPPPTLVPVVKDMSSVTAAAQASRTHARALMLTALRHARNGLSAADLRAQIGAPRTAFEQALRAEVTAGTIQRAKQGRNVVYTSLHANATRTVKKKALQDLLSAERTLLRAGPGGLPLHALRASIGNAKVAEALLRPGGPVRVWQPPFGPRGALWTRHEAYHAAGHAPVKLAYHLHLARQALQQAGPDGLDEIALRRAAHVTAVTPEEFMAALTSQDWAEVRAGQPRHVTYATPGPGWPHEFHEAAD